MASIFEELMSVNSNLTESVRPSVRGKKVESKKIPFKNLKVESVKVFEDADFDDLDQQFDAQPTDDNPDEVVLVIDPEIQSGDEIPEDAAEKMVGDLVYKCPVCGSNYVCGCDPEMQEGIELDDEGVPVECPICGDDAEQILVGEIAPAEDAGEKKEPELVNTEDDGEEEVPGPEDGEDEEVDEGLHEDLECPECEDNVMELATPEEEEDKTPAVQVKDSQVTLVLDDKRFESLMNQVISENYKNDPKFKINRCSVKEGKLRIQYTVTEGKSSKNGLMIAEGFDKKSRKMTLKFKDKGAFTESFSRTPSFVIECVKIKNAVIPTSVNYNYKVKVNESLYRVSGSVKSGK